MPRTFGARNDTLMDEVTQGFADAFVPRERGACKLYLISPQEVGGAFVDRLKAALEPGVAAAFPEALTALAGDPTPERSALVQSLRGVLSEHPFQASVKASLAFSRTSLSLADRSDLSVSL